MAKCPKCSAELPEGALWCSFCGEKIGSAPSAPPVPLQPAADIQTVPDNIQVPTGAERSPATEAPDLQPPVTAGAETASPTSEGAPASAASVPYIPPYPPAAPQQGAGIPPAGYYVPVPAPPAPKRSRKKMFIMGGTGLAGLVAIIAAIAIGIMQIPVCPAVVYRKDSTISFAKQDEWKPLELTYSKRATEFYVSDRIGGLYTQYGDNGRKLFYLDGEESTELYVRDLKKDNTKKDAAVRLDTDLRGSFYVLQDGKYIVYMRDRDARLCLHNMKERITIDQNITTYFPSEDGKRLFYMNDEQSLYMVDVSAKPEPQKIDSEVEEIQDFSPDLSRIYYVKDGSLYFKKKGAEKQKVSSSANNVSHAYYAGGDNAYFLNRVTASSTAWDYVVDDLADQDAATVKPDAPDYGERPVPPKRSDYYDDDFHFNADAYNAAYEEYQQQLEAYQNNKSQLDEAYSQAKKQYKAKLNRDNLRQELKDKTIENYYYELFYYNGSEAKSLGNDIRITAISKAGFALCSRVKTEEAGTLKLSEISDVADVEQMLAELEDNAQRIYSVAAEDNLYDLDADAPENVSFSKSGDMLYYIDNETLWQVNVKTSGMDKAEAIDENVNGYQLLGQLESPVYVKGTTESGYADLYQDGKKIASDIYVYAVSIYATPDSPILYCVTDYSQNSGKGTLVKIADGESTVIAEDIRPYDVVVYGENQVAFLGDYNSDKERGTLMLYTGGKKNTVIDEDVRYILPSRPDNFWYILKLSYLF